MKAINHIFRKKNILKEKELAFTLMKVGCSSSALGFGRLELLFA